jgi:hypothetical protein
MPEAYTEGRFAYIRLSLKSALAVSGYASGSLSRCLAWIHA